MRRSSAVLIFAAFLATALWPGPGSAIAAKPRKGAHYVGLEGGLVPSSTEEDYVDTPDASLRVSRRGRALARSSYVALRCGRSYSKRVALRRPRGKALRIRRGAFSLARRKGGLRFRLRGRFVTRDYVRIVYKVRRGRCRHRGATPAYRDGKPPHRSCRSQAGRNLARNNRGRAYELLTYEGGGSFFTHAIACSFETNKRTDLGHDYDETTVEAVRLGGPYVGYYAFGGAEFATGGEIVVRDLRSGRSLRRIGAGGRAGEVNLVVKANGSVAWTNVANAIEPTGPRKIELWVADTLGQRRIDPGPNVDPGSLRLTGSILTWRSGGAPRSATLH